MIDTPARPAPLSPDQFHTRQAIRAHQQAEQAYHAHQRGIARQIQIDADNERAKAIAKASREQSDDDYDAIKLKDWNENKAKQAAFLAKEKQDALDKTAYLLSSPALVDLFHRSEFTFLKEFSHWCSRGYTLQDDGIRLFQPNFYSVTLTAPAVTKKVAK